MANKLNIEKLIGIVLITCVAISLLIANSPVSDLFFSLMHFKIPVGIGNLKLEKTAEHWINDGLMSIFFLLAGLEIKRELLTGELSTAKKAALPVIAAAGGMLVPALIFTIFNYRSDTMHGWAIPMATDIAFAIGILAIVGKAAPLPLKVFLVALAIVDDIGAILVIALFYSTSVDLKYLLFAAILMLILFSLRRLKISNLFAYLLPGLLLWYFIYRSGIHSTISGVLLALTIPFETADGKRPLIRLEHNLIKPVYFIVLPLFVLVNTAIVLKPEAIVQIASPLGWGIVAGLILGKPIGIVLFSLLGVKIGWAQFPQAVSLKQLIGAGTLAGIGFTMSVFIALLSFDNPLFHDISKMSILLASTISAITGYLILKSAAKENQHTV